MGENEKLLLTLHPLIRKKTYSFPRMETHYSRRDIKKLYLVADLNISVMYRSYVRLIIQRRKYRRFPLVFTDKCLIVMIHNFHSMSPRRINAPHAISIIALQTKLI